MKEENLYGAILTLLLAMVTIGVIVVTASISSIMQSHSANAAVALGSPSGGEFTRAGGTIAVSGSNVYVAWWNNKTGDFEVMFRSSTDNGHTFGPKINLSESPGVASTDAQIAAQGKNVYVIWWERTGTNNNTGAAAAEPFLRISYDNGKTFGEKIMLSSNSSSSSAAAATAKTTTK